MGYYTDYSLDVTLNGEDIKAFGDALEELCVWDGIDDYGVTINAYANAKWYEWETDLCELSVKFPLAFIEIEGVGEESGDMWRAYIQNGACQHCRAIITYDDYDPKKMIRYVEPLVPAKETQVADLI